MGFDRNYLPKFSGSCLLSPHGSDRLQGMRTIVALTAFVLFSLATARCVDAGVILGESPAVISQCTAAMMANLPPLQEEEQQRSSFRQSESSGLSGFSVNVVQAVAQSATIGETGIVAATLVRCGFLTISNAVLPPSPVIDGLLKPS